MAESSARTKSSKAQGPGSTPAPRALLAAGQQRLAEGGVLLAGADARREAEWLLADVLGQRGRAGVYARIDERVSAEEEERFRTLLERRARGEPLAYVLGHADFFGLRLAVSPAVLIPRPETETVVGAALRRLGEVRHPTILDAGTGSGCIALALASERGDAAVHACDVSPDALAVARKNTEACGLDVHLFRADILAADFAQKSPEGLDLLISNPPYVPQAERATLPGAVRDYEPGVALFSGRDPLRFYRVLARHAAALLAPGGVLVLETHADHAGAVAELLQTAGLEDVAVERDTFGEERIAAGRR